MSQNPQQQPIPKEKKEMMYFYDLPTTTTSVMLAEKIKNLTGHQIDPAAKPQLRKIPGKLYSGIVQIKLKPDEDLEEIKKKLRHFEIDG